MANIHARLAHMGIYVHDKDKMERFYTEVLGLMITDHGEGRAGMHLTFMSGNPQNHHQMVLVTGRPDTSGFNPSSRFPSWWIARRSARGAQARTGTGRHRNAAGEPRQCLVDLFQGPGRQHGGGISRHAVPRAAAAWQAARPCQVGRADPAETEEACRQDPGFMPIEQFKTEMATRLGARTDDSHGDGVIAGPLTATVALVLSERMTIHARRFRSAIGRRGCPRT